MGHTERERERERERTRERGEEEDRKTGLVDDVETGWIFVVTLGAHRTNNGEYLINQLYSDSR